MHIARITRTFYSLFSANLRKQISYKKQFKYEFEEIEMQDLENFR